MTKPQPALDPADPDWAGQLRAVARDYRALALAHPHVVPLLVTRPLATPLALRPPGTLRPLEDVLALLTRAGFSGADALLAAGPTASGVEVDVVVTEEPSGSGRGRTYVAASGVPLIALGSGVDGPGPGGLTSATLGLTRRQALKLIAAENFARQVTLLPEG